ncbi:MAG: methylmalonyl-CoA carboxyltransferase [Hyphomicrobiaceae bacterium]|nr:methylmalonyl-CoA carboxyltransferase [Hyphomicrobiaceae bacterium]
MPHEETLAEFEERRARVRSMGGEAKLAARRSQGVLNARERIARLVDPDTFVEVGEFGTSILPEQSADTPADGKIVGYGKIAGRMAAVVSNDFTVKGASSSAVNGRKIAHMKRVATQRGLPVVFLGESSGARMPDTMGARGMGTMLGNDPMQYQRMRETPWASAVLGSCFGSSSWYACCSDFNVMRKGAVLAVSSPLLVSKAVNEAVDAEELGGWRLHAEVTGLADQVVDSDEAALDAIRTFLSYLPSHHNEPPPRAAVPAGSGAEMAGIAGLVPERRSQVYDMRRIVRCIVDKDSYFELKPRFGKAITAGLARIDGRTVAIIANNPLHKGGAIDTDACDKATSLLVMADSFNIPLVLLVDTPGFVIGREAEVRRAPGKIMNFMNALSLVTMPKISIVLRKSYGQAYLNMAGGRNSDEMAVWPTAEISFMEPAFAASVVTNAGPGDPGYEAALQKMQRETSVWDIASIFAAQAVVRPDQTRDYLKQMLETHEMRMTRGVGQHLMRTWPTSY